MTVCTCLDDSEFFDATPNNERCAVHGRDAREERRKLRQDLNEAQDHIDRMTRDENGVALVNAVTLASWQALMKRASENIR